MKQWSLFGGSEEQDEMGQEDVAFVVEGINKTFPSMLPTLMTTMFPSAVPTLHPSSGPTLYS